MPAGIKLNPDNRWVKKAEYGYSDEDTAATAYTEYNDEKPPFDPSLTVYFRKRLTPEILGEINEMIIRNSESKENSDDEDKSNPPSNKGTMIVDATYAPLVARLKYTTCHCLAMSVLLLNLRKIGKVLFTIFLSWFQKLLGIYNVSRMAIIQ